jgi:hypothetical protein
MALPARAQNSPRFYQMDETHIAAALKQIHHDNTSLQARVEAVSAAFLGIPYKLGPLGEGGGAEFDGDPLYSFSQLDCTTSIEEIMALSIEPDLDKAVHDTLQKIRYKDGQIGYTTRNHFTEADWVPNNVAAGYLQDITRDVAGNRAKDAHKLVSKSAWYAGKSLDAIKGFPGETQADRQRRLKDLQALAAQFKDEGSTIAYVPMDVFPQVLANIPSGTIANLVRADQPGKPTIISHQILLIDKDGTKYVREAASGKEFLDVPALDYFRIYNNSSWPLLGLNLNQILDPGHP